MSSATSEESTAKSSLIEHLIEMRDRLLRSVIVVGVAFICLFGFSKDIYNWLAAPLVNQGQEMIIIGTVAPFLIPMKLTLLVSFLIALPYLFYQLWLFVAPGLYKHEKRLIYPLIASSIFLFYLGIAFVYFILLPMMFKIIPQFAPDVATYQPDIAQYLDFTIMMFIAFGFGFEMPIATILLISTGMTTADDLRKKRPYVIVGAFVVGMFLTPPDVISQIMLAIPMWLLFELGLVFSTIFNVRVKEAGDARKARDESDSSSETTNNNTAKKNIASSAAVASSDSPVISGNELWEDENESDDYIYEDELEENISHLGYQDADSFEMGSESQNIDDIGEDDADEGNTDKDKEISSPAEEDSATDTKINTDLEESDSMNKASDSSKETD